MKIVVLGGNSGAHFVSQKLLEEDNVKKLYQLGANLAIPPSEKFIPLDLSVDEILEFLDKTELDFVFVNTINYLLNKRIQNKIKEKGIPSCSPGLNLCMLEWSKSVGKKLLNELKIPTGKSRILKKDQLFKEFFDIPRPWVLKFEKDWRAGFQTIIITDENINLEFKNLQLFGNKRFMHYIGDFNDQQFVVEDFIVSKREYSYHILCNENSWEYMGSARDYKKMYDGDIGPNTAGMGCYSPVDINPKVHEYADKILNHLKSIGTPYIGILYLGIMEDLHGNPYVLEINTRPGDPELQSILLTIDNSQAISNLLFQAATGQKIDKIKTNNKHAVCLRIVNSEYENIIKTTALQDWKHLKGHHNPQLWPELPGIYISIPQIRKLLNSVIATCGDTRIQAIDKIYKFLENIEMYNFRYRKDIGYLE
jgi:phosphoribosylamine--glycine ligase